MRPTDAPLTRALPADYTSAGDPIHAYPEGLSLMWVTEGGWPGVIVNGAIVHTLLVDQEPTREQSFSPDAHQVCVTVGERPSPREPHRGSAHIRHWREGESWWSEWQEVNLI
jgi:hypothetical protein